MGASLKIIFIFSACCKAGRLFWEAGCCEGNCAPELLTASGKSLQAVLGRRHQVMKVCVGNPWLWMFLQSQGCATAQLWSDRCSKCQMVPQEVIDSGVGINVLPSFYSLLFLWLVGPFLGGRSCFERLPLGISNSSPMLACPVSPFTPLLLPSRCLGSQLSLWHEFLKKLGKIWKFWRPDSV